MKGRRQWVKMGGSGMGRRRENYSQDIVYEKSIFLVKRRNKIVFMPN